MLFTSPQFLLMFLPITFTVFLFLQRFNNLKISSLWLLLASIAFYLFWNPHDLLPLIFSIVVNFILYRWMSLKTGHLKTLILIIALLFNLILLGYYKYFHFIFGLNHETTTTATIPLGISFYTFTQIAFLVDCYKNNYQNNDFLNYSLFVSYFPHLVCGPIISFKDLYPQLTNPKKFHFSSKSMALFIFCFSIGLFKKTFIADQFGDFVAAFFDAPGMPYFGQKTAFLGVVSYSLQLYFDFSGYSDMAVGLSYLFGLQIPDNFNSPYQSTSIIEFWRRWHISLSSFLKNYLYIPLGGNRKHHYLNVFITMVLGGLWHGASWTFIVWGAYQGVLLSINHWWRNKTPKPATTNSSFKVYCKKTFKTLFIFTLISLGWVLFRSANLETAYHIYSSLLGISKKLPQTIESYCSIKLMLAALLWVFLIPDTLVLREQFLTVIEKKSHFLIRIAALLCAILSTFGLIALSRVQYFLYSGF